MRDYSDIKMLRRPQYPDLPPMSIHDRAAQFSPFAALVGFEDAVTETERLTDSRREMLEDEIGELNRQLGRLSDRLGECPMVRITYFVKDSKKDGGSYCAKTGNVRTIDHYGNALVFTDKTTIPIKELYSLVFIDY